MKRLLLMTLSVLAVTACDRSADAPATDTAATNEPVQSATVDASVYAAALASTTRLDGDYARDANRKPDEVLAFLGVVPGMKVLDLFSGGGYYSEIIANVVGQEGHVDAHTNQAYLGFVGDEFDQRHAEGRLSNVDLLWAENNELSLEAGTYDAIMMVLTFHDLFHVDEENGWAAIDAPQLLGELRSGLKDDGFIGIIDHYAEDGAPPEVGDSLHRIDRALVISMMEMAGFVCDAESDILRNPDDDLSRIVFDPELRGRTDRFILRFRKAE